MSVLLPSCIEFRKSLGHKVKFLEIFNYLTFTLHTVKFESAKHVIFAETLHRYLKLCAVYGIWNAVDKLGTAKSLVPTFCQLLPPECALGLSMNYGP